MRRNCILEPSTAQVPEARLENHLVATIASNSHLCPLPERKKPVYWNHDQALALFPLPDTLILGDQYNSFHLSFDNMVCFNPGSFALDSHFYNYEPFKDDDNGSCSALPESSNVPELDT